MFVCLKSYFGITIPLVNDSLFLSSQASDPTTASIEYCCATAGTSLPPVPILFLSNNDRGAAELTQGVFFSLTPYFDVIFFKE